jgi:hypothetical protein
MRYLNTLVNFRTDATILTANEKKDKITASFVTRPVNVAALCVLVVILFFFSLAGPSQAAPSPAPGWTMDSVTAPTNFVASAAATAECVNTIREAHFPVFYRYEASAIDAGATATSGPVTLTDTLPAGVTVRRVQFLLVQNGQNTQSALHLGGITKEEPASEDCTGAGYPAPSETVVQCTYPDVFPEILRSGNWLKIVVYVTVDEGASSPLPDNRAEVSGGGAASVSTEQSAQIGSAPAPFGVSNFSFYKDALNGSEERQAGGHPYELTTTIDLNTALRNEPGTSVQKGDGTVRSPEDVKDVVVDLPLGFAGSTLAAPQCTEAQLDSEAHCPPETVVGHLTTEPLTDQTSVNGPIWNIAPEHGHPAEFGYIDALKSAHTAGYVSVVPTPAGYVLQFVAQDIPEVSLSRLVVTFYGDPAEEQAATRQEAIEEEREELVKREVPGVQVPFFTNPTACSNGPQVAKLWVDSWQHPASFDPGTLIPANLHEEAWKEATSESPPVAGCNALQFTPELGAQPTTHEADTPSGLEFETKLAQSETFGTDATPALKDLTVDFPEGMTVDPSSANGLGVCSEAQIGYEGDLPHPTLFDFTQAPPACPESSKIGSLELETPLLPGILHGEVFLAAQNENPFGSTFAIYVVVNDPVTGVVLKIAGELKSDPRTGRMTAVFDENPQLPFSVLKVHFFGGPRAELATPPSCGLYTTDSVMEPWSTPPGGAQSSAVGSDSGPSATPFDDYLIDENCATGFAPNFAALTSNIQAGQYTPFEGSFSREDNDQELSGLTMNLPQGLLARIPSVTECGAAEIAAEAADAPSGGCPASSQVGTVTAEAGPGPNPLAVPGKIFWTGPYNGGPFGLAVVVSANPGPFHFGNVVVRQSLRINPLTAAATDVSDPFPTFLDPVGANGQTSGIPIKLRRVDFDIDGVGGDPNHPFTFNPASCNKFTVGGTITSTQGQSKALEAPFQVTNCATLKFQPKLTVTTSAKTSKADGASLAFKIAYPKSAGIGSTAWFKAMKFTIPKQLPARLTTIQKACLNATFEQNPAACPAASVIGHAVVHTEILPVPLSGPLYFVSHGGAKFPEAVLVLQGDGVKLVVHGETFISHSGVTSATFKTVPEAPFETVEVSVPTGPYSEFAANGNLCTSKLKMPIEFTSSNGALIKEEAPIGVSGCKPAITVVSHKVKGKTATIQVSVPGAGRLVATGKGLSKASKTAKGATTLTVKLTLTNAEVATLKKHHAKRLKAKINLTFSPRKGDNLKTTTTVNIA